LDSSGSEQRPVAGSCKHGNEPLGSTKCRKFLNYLSILLASQGGLCSVELVLRTEVACSIFLCLYILIFLKTMFPLQVSFFSKILCT
jgi:hypothetical protein